MSSRDTRDALNPGNSAVRPSFHALSTPPKSHWAGPGIPTPGREIWGYFGQLALHGSRCSACEAPNCWGSAILRISYDDDAQFALAVAAIRRLAVVAVEYEHEIYTNWDAYFPGSTPRAKKETRREDMHKSAAFQDMHKEKEWLAFVNGVRARMADPSQPLNTDRLVTDELKDRFHTNVVEDRAALEGTGPEEAQIYYRDSSSRPVEHSIRGDFFLYFDQETIEHLAGAPSDEELAQMSIDEQCKVAWQYWTKIIATVNDESYVVEDDDDGTYADQLRIEDRKRVRLLDLLHVYLQLMGVAGVSELLVEGSDRTRNPQDVKKEWCFVGNFDGPSIEQRLLEEVYGRRGRPGHYQ